MTQKSHIEEIKKMSGGKFTEEDIGNFINMAARISSKSILTHLIHVITEGRDSGLDQQEGNRLIQRITDIMPYKDAGYTQIEMNGYDMKLNISLSICDIGYRTEIDVPDDKEFIKELCQQYVFIKKCACAYWKQFCQEHPEIFERICDYRSDIDFSDFIVDPQNETVMYLDPACKKRVGIFCYYTDKNNRPYVKKSRK